MYAYFFPVDILKQAWKMLISKEGFFLFLINFVIFFFSGIIILVSSLLILGPAAYLLQNPALFSGIVVFLLYFLFIDVVLVFILCEQYIMLICIERIFLKKYPLFGIKMFEGESTRFIYYVKTVLFSAMKVMVGCLCFVIPGIKAFFQYMLSGIISVFTFSDHKEIEKILEESKRITQGKLLPLASLVISSLLALFISEWVIGQIFTQFFLMPFLSLLVTLSLVLFCKQYK